jgi:subtilase family serine protease
MARCNAFLRTDVGGRPIPDSALYGPADLISAYKLPTSKGTGQTVAIVDAFDNPNAESDLGMYRSYYGLPACTTANGCFRKLNQAGKPGPYPAGKSGWGIEIDLDIDMVSASCPKCHILLVEGNSDSFADLAASVDTAVAKGGNVVSNSYGGGVSGGDPFGSHYNYPGHIILASSGDSGPVIQFPADQASVISVGGTTLNHHSGRRGWIETAWGPSGSGCTTQPKPSWQHDSCTYRTMNDVAAIADPGVVIYDSYGLSPGFYGVGGTSVSSPLLGGVYGLAGNAASLNAAQSLYTAGPKALFDVGGQAEYSQPTGNGTPRSDTAF